MAKSSGQRAGRIPRNPGRTVDKNGNRVLMPFDMALMDSRRQCPAHSKRTGKRCNNFCSLGMTTCRIHGSGTVKARIAATERIRAAAGYAAALLVELMADPAVDVKLRADIARDVLTRAGVEEARRLEVEHTVRQPWEDMVLSGEIFRIVPDDELPAPTRADDPEIVDAEVVPAADSEAAHARYVESRARRDVERVDGPRPPERRRR